MKFNIDDILTQDAHVGSIFWLCDYRVSMAGHVVNDILPVHGKLTQICQASRVRKDVVFVIDRVVDSVINPFHPIDGVPVNVFDNEDECMSFYKESRSIRNHC